MERKAKFGSNGEQLLDGFIFVLVCKCPVCPLEAFGLFSKAACFLTFRLLTFADQSESI